MSLDLWLSNACPHCESEEEYFAINLTYNYSRMWSKALGSSVKLVNVDGMTGEQSAATFRKAIEAMDKDPEGFRELDPDNGWGKSVWFREHLVKCLEAATEYPAAVWESWR